MKKFLFFIFSLVVGILLFSWILSTEGTRGLTLGFKLFFTWGGLSLLGLTFVITLIATLRWREILKSKGLKAPFFELWKVYLGGFGFNYFLPILVFGGDMVRSYFLKQSFSFSKEESIACTIADRILELTSDLLFILPGLVLFLLGVGLPPQNVAVSLFGFLFIVGGGITLFYFKSAKRESMLRLFRVNHHRALRVEQQISEFFRSEKVFIPLSLSFLKSGLMLLRIWLLMAFLGQSVSISITWATFTFAWVGTQIPIPADLGSHEAIQVYVFKALGLASSTGTALALIIRGLEAFISMVGIFFIFRFGMRFLEEIVLNKIFNSFNDEQ